MLGFGGKKLIKRERLLIGVVRMWGFELFDDERAIKPERAPAPTYVLVLTYLNQKKLRQTQHENYPPPAPGSTTPGNRSRYSEEKKGEKKLVGPCSVVDSFQGSLVGLFSLARSGSLTWSI